MAWLSGRTKPGAADLHDVIEAVEGEITTFGRFVQTKAVRPILGYSFKGSEVVPTEGTSETVLYARLMAAVKDLAGGKDVNDLRTAEQRVAYAHFLAGSSESGPEDEPEAHEEPAAQDAQEPEGEQSTDDDDQKPASQSDPQEEPKPRRRRRASQPKPNVLDAPLPDVFKPRIVEISEELCDLNVHKTPNAVAVLLRLLIEMTTEQCRSAENLQKKGDLNKHIQLVINRVQTPEDQQDNVFHGVTVSLSTPGDRDHTKNFNQHVHNVGYHPVPTDLINTAQNYRPYFERIGQRLANKAAS